MRKIVLAILGLLAATSLVACSQSSVTRPNIDSGSSSGKGVTAPATTMAPAPITKTLPPPTVIVSPPPQYSSDTTTASSERMIVRTGNISMIVEDVNTAIDRISTIAGQSKGYVVSSNSWRDGERLHGSISIRMPSGDFANVMTAITQLAVEVTSQTTSSQDVTEEYVDLSSRLKNLQATEQQLLQIMAKAEKVEDILSVERELSNTRSQIEQTSGRMQYLEKTAAMSLIQVNLEQSKLDAKLTASRRFIRSGESVQFTAQVAGGFVPYSYQWDFGDGKTSNDPAPNHPYRAAGDYSVSLTVTDDRGNTASADMKDYVTVQSGWSAMNVAAGAWNGFASFGRGLFSVAVWLGIFSPIWIIGLAILYWRLRRRRKAA